MTTLEGRYRDRLRDFDARRRAVPDLEARVAQALERGDFRAAEAAGQELTRARAADDDEVAYVLAAMPFLREYYASDVAGPDAAAAAGAAPEDPHHHAGASSSSCPGEASSPAGLPPPQRAGAYSSHPHASALWPSEDRQRQQPAAASAMDRFITVRQTGRQKAVFDDYLERVEEPEVREALRPPRAPAPRRRTRGHTRDIGLHSYTCPWGCLGHLVVDHAQAQSICTTCGRCLLYMDTAAARCLTFEQAGAYSRVTTYAYKRLNHFTEWLNALQGRENTVVPEEVIEAIRAEFKKSRAATRADIRPEKVLAFLKKLKLNKYYEHKYHICNALNGTPPPRVPPELEDALKRMFQSIQAPFERHCPPTRKNFLSYSYVLYKLFELLGERSYLPYFPLLKSHEKLYQQDVIWRNICQDLDWQFVSSR